MNNWRVIRGTDNPVEVIDGDKRIVMRVYDWSWPIEQSGLSSREHRKIQALKKAGLIILAVKMLEIN